MAAHPSALIQPSSDWSNTCDFPSALSKFSTTICWLNTGFRMRLQPAIHKHTAYCDMYITLPTCAYKYSFIFFKTDCISQGTKIDL